MAPPPVVTGVSPKEGPPGTRVTIRGEFLGSSATDLIGLKICGCDCLLSAEWKSRNKIVARSGPCKGRGDIIVTTRSGGEGTSTVQFRGYHESVGPVKESAVWVEEAAPATLAWGRRPLSPASYAPPDPLGLSTDGDECKFPEEDLHEMFPDRSGKLSDENFHPGWYLLEHHSMTTFEDLRAGALFLERKVDGQKEGQLSFLKANTGAVMEQLDRLILVKNMFEEDHRQNGKEPLISLQNALEDSIRSADGLFSDILARKEKADRTRAALALLIRHKFLFQLPASIDRNIRKKEYDLVVNDYTRVKNLFGWTEVKLFQKILAEIDQRIFDLRDKLHKRIQTMPIHIQEQRKFIQVLLSLSWEGDAAWDAINSRKDYLMSLLGKLKDHFKQKEQLDLDKSKRKCSSGGGGGGGVDAGGGGEWGVAWVAAACGALAEEVAALWTLARWYFAGELGGTPTSTDRSATFKQMILSAVEVFATHMRSALLSGGGGGGAGADSSSALVANLQRLRDAHEALLKLDLPSQPLEIVRAVIQEYRVHGMVGFLQRGVKKVKGLGSKETWHVEEYSEYGAVTKLPRLFETYATDTLSSIHACVAEAGRKESALLEEGSAAAAVLHKHTQEMALAYVGCLQALALDNADQDFSNNSLSVALGNQKLEGGEGAGAECASGGRPSWQLRLLITASNAQYTRHVTLNNIAATFEKYSFPKASLALQNAKEALSRLEGTIAATYLEHKEDPLVGTIEQSMYMGRYKWDASCLAKDARPYVYEIINNLIAVHAEMDSVCGQAWSRYVRDICETVCEELARLAACEPEPESRTRAACFQARLELRMLHAAVSSLLSRKAENYLMEALAGVPPLENQEDIRLVEKIIGDFRKRMELQIMSLNSNTETV